MQLQTKALIHLTRIIASTPNLILYNSAKSRLQHEEAGYPTAKGYVIPNGFDCDTFSPAPRVQSDRTVVGMLARFDPVKGFDVFIEAAAQLATMFPKTEFKIFGTNCDDRNSYLTSLVQQRNLQGRLDLCGAPQSPSKALQSLDIFVLPSLSEAFPNVLGEAMACGLPCIASDVGDVSTILGTAGILVPPGSVNRLAEAIRSVLEMSETDKRMMGSEARLRICQKYSIEKIASCFYRAYEQIAEGITHLDGSPSLRS